MKFWRLGYGLRRVNRKLEQQIGEKMAEKRGMRWALTRFAGKAWGQRKGELFSSMEMFRLCAPKLFSRVAKL